MTNDETIRGELTRTLSGRGAHIPFEAAVEGFPYELVGRRVDRIPHTMWHLVEHMRIAQWDIVDFCRDPAHVSPEYPKGYWPQVDGPESREAWEESLAAFARDLEDMKAMVSDPESDLYTPFAHGDGQNLLREAVVLTDHNSYHLAQIVDLRMLLGVPVRDW